MWKSLLLLLTLAGIVAQPTFAAANPDCGDFGPLSGKIRSASLDELSEMADQAPEIARETFAARLKIREGAARVLRGELPKECADQMRNAMNDLRLLEDYLAMLYGRRQQKNETPIQDLGALRGDSPVLMINPNIVSAQEKDGEGRVALRSGDILLSRGARFLSAMIAKITKPAGLFSHAALVYIDDKTGQTYTVEAHIEVGVLASPISKYMNPSSSRVVVFRYKDPELAHAAAKNMFDRAVRQSDKGRNIPYDFSMDTSDHGALFCSEVPSNAYEAASGGKVKVPAFRSRMDLQSEDFMDRLGIHVSDTFAPSDMEMDPDFELIAEWRNLEKIQGTWFSDALMTRIYDWMENRNYVLKSTFGVRALKWFVWTFRKLPILKEPLRKSLPSNMSRNVLEVVALLNKVEGKFYKNLEKSNNEKFARDDVLLRPSDLEAMIERVREADFAQYEKDLAWKHDFSEESRFTPRPKVLFHRWLSPAEMN
ncbi:MAG: hypothetical protein A2X94_01055 [Bdellovibrionales bacterium GWB1_55_8]|nr:MAG: hypothetical protein A2X94_01055 [Bdellovibrionales bacterium GWB1_55_8]